MKRIALFLIGCLVSAGAVAVEFTADRTVLITGANRGIGLGLVNEYVDRGWNVIATARNPDGAEDLKTLAASYENLAIEQLDVTDAGQVEALAARYQGQPIDVLINNAGVKPGPGAMNGIEGLDFENAQLMFDVNVIGPLRVIQALLPNVEASEQKKIVNMGSVVASYEAGPSMPALYNYRSSKSMMQTYTYVLGIEMQPRGVTAFAIHPGAVNVNPEQQDDPNQGNQGPVTYVNVKESTSKVVQVIEDTGLDKNGRLVNFQNGEALPF